MAWTAKILMWHEDEAEIRVDVDYLDTNDEQQASELVILPAGTADARVLEEIGRRGRAARARISREHTGDNTKVGQEFPIDSL